MRQTRTKVRRKSAGKKFTFMIIIMVLFGLSISIGYLGTKHMILPMLASKEVAVEKNNEDQEKKVVKPSVETTPVAKEVIKQESPQIKETKEVQKATKEVQNSTFEIEGLNIYSVQVGSFSTKENAQALVKELNTKNMGACIWHNDGYKVITTSMLDRKSIEQIIPDIKKEYNEAFVVTRKVPKKIVQYKKEDSDYIEVLESQQKKLMEVFTSLSQNIKQLQSPQMDSDLVEGWVKDLKKIQEALKKKKLSEEIKTINDELIKVTDELVQELEKATKDDKKLLVETKNAFMKGIGRYSDFLENNEY
ncbi:MAG: SPOR domain-containing protein [Marinisporobacter sp.]|jgi:hypothetical protein|nr:SPOR domain-containing protein [Marinisporobacter sp.]